MFILPKNVTIIEVGPRDGLQNEKNHVGEEEKLEFIHLLQSAGIKEMELTSFVSPKWVPQMADAKNIVEKAKKIGRQFVLAPNEKGADLAIEAGAENIAVFVGVSNTFNKKNINRTTIESMNSLELVIAKLKSDGIFVRACISTAFYCPYEGKIEIEEVSKLCSRFISMGVDELSVADTIGMANPMESYELFNRLKDLFPDVLLTAHFHDTRKMAIANIFAAMQAGVNRFDTSAGGLGGCPFAPGATGNVATEDVVHMLHSLGIETGIDVEKICEAVGMIAPHVSHPIETGMYKLYKNRSS
ncbi:hydroxymethylglutaryl-CoA lyase [Sporosarcina sp. ACRSL]|uniref:hydroxymethylglutaryl-CoA lyase n=1 Tax=Sporosarcina sp. ACRSL TaxID=2918215 RepID=UPI001EF57A31|nr:hydroxymethylglutaryl-CoA lyase [Sporosarcina sp. ACRSL]MCG7342964.1 hydroxymethylglutaryl-CoA lyase [Sporosarcina sp. ACRSL]